MSNENTTPPSFGESLGNALLTFIRFLVRLLVILVLAGLLAAALYFGVPALYRQYVQPLQSQVTQLESTQASQEQNYQQLTQRIDDLQSRVDTLEVQNDSAKQNIASLQTGVDNVQSTQQANLSAAAGVQATASAQIEDVNTSFDALNTEVAVLSTAVEQTNRDFQSLTERLQTADTPVAALSIELQMVKAMELLTRSRISLVTNNLGLAQEDVRAARDYLAALQPQVPAYQLEALNAIISRLDTALSNLPDSPVLAADDMEIAWQLLQRGLPGEGTPVPIPGSLATTPFPTGEGTPSATLTGTPATGTPPATASPTPTPTLTSTPTPTATP